MFIANVEVTFKGHSRSLTTALIDGLQTISFRVHVKLLSYRIVNLRSKVKVAGNENINRFSGLSLLQVLPYALI